MQPLIKIAIKIQVINDSPGDDSWLTPPICALKNYIENYW